LGLIKCIIIVVIIVIIVIIDTVIVIVDITNEGTEFTQLLVLT
jgi:hypothetical protein